jgi:hypothetical protein
MGSKRPAEAGGFRAGDEVWWTSGPRADGLHPFAHRGRVASVDRRRGKPLYVEFLRQPSTRRGREDWVPETSGGTLARPGDLLHVDPARRAADPLEALERLMAPEDRVAARLIAFAERLTGQVGEWEVDEVRRREGTVVVRAADASYYEVSLAAEGEPEALPGLAVRCLVTWRG